MSKAKFKRMPDDKPGEYERHLHVAAQASSRLDATRELARVYGALGVLTVEEAIKEIERLKGG